MSRLRLQRDRARSPQPARDLPFVDAVAVLVALFLAYATRAVVSAYWPFEWAAVGPFVRVALPVSLCAVLLSAAAMGLYGARAAAAGVREHVAAAAYAAALAAAVGIYWGGASPPSIEFVASAAVVLAACLHGGRLLYWRIADRDPMPDPGAVQPDG